MNSSNQQAYQIFVAGLNLPIRLGCAPEERKHFQNAQLDLVFDVATNLGSEDLSQTVCYLTAANFALSHAQSQEWALIENFLDSLITEFFAKFIVCTQIEAKLTKFVVPGCQGAGVKITRQRAGASK